MTITCNTESELPQVAAQLLEAWPDDRVFAFDGEMGAGKTTFIKVLCETLGVQQVTNSPTFAIVNEYVAGNGEPIYHFDFYRITSIDEAYQIGFEDYLYSDCYCFIEWPDKVAALLDEQVVRVKIEVLADGSRQFTF